MVTGIFTQNTWSTQSALMKMPRKDRAIAQGDWPGRNVNGFAVVRLTRRYWSVEGNAMKLNKAVEVIGG